MFKNRKNVLETAIVNRRWKKEERRNRRGTTEWCVGSYNLKFSRCWKLNEKLYNPILWETEGIIDVWQVRTAKKISKRLVKKVKNK